MHVMLVKAFAVENRFNGSEVLSWNDRFTMPVLSPVQMADGNARAFLNLTIHIDVLWASDLHIILLKHEKYLLIISLNKWLVILLVLD
jgi:hypothetical protein